MTYLRLSCVMLLLLVTSVSSAKVLRVSPDWLNQNIEQQQLIILDTRPTKAYQAGHIKGALSFPDAMTYQQKSAGGRIVEPDIMQQRLRKLGISNDAQIVVYDAGKLIDAARVFWSLEVYGLKNVRLLSPGYDAWLKQGYPVSNEVPDVTQSNYVATVDHRRIASKFTTQLATMDNGQLIVDARFPNMYKGEKSTAKRNGHIPTAINIPVTTGIVKESGIAKLRSVDELKKVYAELPKDKKIVLYCEIGRGSSTNYLVLRELGYDVANYDASWREWGNDFNLPIEK